MRKRMIAAIMAVLVCGVMLAGCKQEAKTSNTSQETVNKGSTSENFCDGYELADFDKFNSPASENGLGGTFIYIDGTVGEIETTNIDIGDALNCVVTTEDGKQWSVLLSFSIGSTKENYINFVGEKAVVCGIYNGYSGKLNMPAMDMVKMINKNTGEVKEGFGATAQKLGLLDNYTSQTTTQATTTTVTTTKTTAEKPKTGNYLIDEGERERGISVWNGTRTEIIGSRMEIKADKSKVKQMKASEFRTFVEFIDVYIKAYNWVTIDFGDGTGIVFPGNVTQVADYGTIDKDGSIIKSKGQIIPSQEFNLSKILSK